MMKRLMKYAVAALLALALPAHAADRVYTLCDPMTAKMCASVVALYEFEEDTATYGAGRTSETGTAQFLEPAGVDVARADNGTLTTGTYCLDLASPQYLYIPRSPSLGASFTMNLWIKLGSAPATTNIIRTFDGAGSRKGSYLQLNNSSGSITPRFYVKQSISDTESYVAASAALSNPTTTWHLITFGIYATPTTTEPYQQTLWMQIDGGTKTTTTVTYPPQVFLGDFQLVSTDQTHVYYDQLSIFSGTLSAGEVTWLYNSGSGRPWPFSANP